MRRKSSLRLFDSRSHRSRDSSRAGGTDRTRYRATLPPFVDRILKALLCSDAMVIAAELIGGGRVVLSESAPASRHAAHPLRSRRGVPPRQSPGPRPRRLKKRFRQPLHRPSPGPNIGWCQWRSSFPDLPSIRCCSLMARVTAGSSAPDPAMPSRLRLRRFTPARPASASRASRRTAFRLRERTRAR